MTPKSDPRKLVTLQNDRNPLPAVNPKVQESNKPRVIGRGRGARKITVQCLLVLALFPLEELPKSLIF